MTEQALLLQENNNKVLHLLEQLYDKKEYLIKEISELELKSHSLELELNRIVEELDGCKKQLEKKRNQQEFVNNSLVEAENVYTKIVESTNGLVCVLQKEIQQISSGD